MQQVILAQLASVRSPKAPPMDAISPPEQSAAEMLKKPSPAFILYSQAVRGIVKAVNPNLTPTQLGARVCKQWTSLPADERYTFLASSMQPPDPHSAATPPISFSGHSASPCDFPLLVFPACYCCEPSVQLPLVVAGSITWTPRRRRKRSTPRQQQPGRALTTIRQRPPVLGSKGVRDRV